MNSAASDLALLNAFSEFVSGEMGLHFPATRRADLRRGIQLAARRFGFEDVDACMRWLMSAPLSRERMDILAGTLTVGETYFFRDKKTFEVLEQDILPEIACRRRREGRTLRIWSAACCSGEEAYSLAISLRRTVPDVAQWQVLLQGTDINPEFLRKAAEGVFNGWSFRDTPEWLRDRYFQKIDHDRWQISEDVRRMVQFRRLNLAQDVYPSTGNETHAQDVIFCRNVLIYFDNRLARRIITRLHRCLADDGWLIVGPSETPRVRFAGFEQVNLDGLLVYRKTGRTTRVPVANTSTADSDSIERSSLAEKTSTHPAEHAPNWFPNAPSTTHATLESARKLANEGELDGALAQCRELVLENKLDPGAHYLLASILQERGDRDGAATALGRALFLDPDFILAHFALANVARSVGKHQEARRHLRHAHALAGARPSDEPLPESEGITAGRLRQIIASLMETDRGGSPKE